MFDDLLDDLAALSTADVRQATLDEIEDLCKNPVFRLLCDLCDVLDPRPARERSKRRK